MTNIRGDLVYTQNIESVSLERLDGLIACDAFLDTYTSETQSVGYSNPLLSQSLASAQEAPASAVLHFQESFEPLGQAAAQEQWGLILELRSRTDEDYAVLQGYLVRNRCAVLEGWLEAHPNASSMREVGLFTLRDILEDKPPASAGDAFAAILVQRSITQIISNTDHGVSAFMEWGTTVFSEDEYRQLHPVYEHLSSSYTMSTSPVMHSTPRQPPIMDFSEFLGSGSGFASPINASAPPDFTQSSAPPLFDAAQFNDLYASVDPFYSFHTMDGDFDQVLHSYTTSYADSELLLDLTPLPSLTGSTSVDGNGQVQTSFGLGPMETMTSSHLHDLGSLCSKLKGTPSWAMLLAFLQNKASSDTTRSPLSGTGDDDLLNRFCVPKSTVSNEGRSQSPTLPSQVRNSRFKEGIETHLLTPLSSGSVMFPEQAIMKGVANATKVMLSIGRIMCLRHVEEYLLSLVQALLRERKYREAFASDVLERCFSLATLSDSIPCLRLEGMQSEGYYSSQYIASRMMQVRNGLGGDYDPTGIVGAIYAQQQMRTTFQAPVPLDQSRSILAEPDVFSNDVSETSSPHGVDSQSMASSTQEAAGGAFYCGDCKKIYRGKIWYVTYVTYVTCIDSTSTVAFRGTNTMADATKGAFVAFIHFLAEQLVEKGIHVGAVAPGPVHTPLEAASRARRVHGGASERIPSLAGPGNPPSDVATPNSVFLAAQGLRGLIRAGVARAYPLGDSRTEDRRRDKTRRKVIEEVST